jgi:hypothetical protein
LTKHGIIKLLNAATDKLHREGVNMQRVYWVQYLALVNRLCKFLLANRGKLPTDLQADATSLFELAEAVCLTLQAYDRTHARGKGVVA